MEHISGFTEFYLTPFLFAIGLVLFFNGVVNYFIIGPAFEEERREMGRQSLLWATLFFLIGIAVFGLANWITSLSGTFEDRVDVELGSDVDTVPIPNVPGVQ